MNFTDDFEEDPNEIQVRPGDIRRQIEERENFYIQQLQKAQHDNSPSLPSDNEIPKLQFQPVNKNHSAPISSSKKPINQMEEEKVNNVKDSPMTKVNFKPHSKASRQPSLPPSIEELCSTIEKEKHDHERGQAQFEPPQNQEFHEDARTSMQFTNFLPQDLPNDTVIFHDESRSVYSHSDNAFRNSPMTINLQDVQFGKDNTNANFSIVPSDSIKSRISDLENLVQRQQMTIDDLERTVQSGIQSTANSQQLVVSNQSEQRSQRNQAQQALAHILSLSNSATNERNDERNRLLDHMQSSQTTFTNQLQAQINHSDILADRFIQVSDTLIHRDQKQQERERENFRYALQIAAILFSVCLIFILILVLTILAFK